MKRLAQIEEIKGVAILLASQASNFITGSTIAIDGGHSCW
jgi:NAD(P)-dependent dehydrogenase (short-subunit alcohol dehydrogenase family)